MLCLSYLLGLLMVDMQFDVALDESVTNAYYCTLTHSFTTWLGLMRIGLPAAAVAVSQLALIWVFPVGPLHDLQSLLASLLVFVGAPVMAISVTVCTNACLLEDATAWPPLSLIRGIHAVMFLLLSSGVVIQSYILTRCAH